mmetsp:Transcript_3205/g.7531  ORF Transcript_3205/g.7531 Transcript_3205/m.7531 type:complete len:274 (-) Transcript_3205:1188-2009(-)
MSHGHLLAWLKLRACRKSDWSKRLWHCHYTGLLQRMQQWQLHLLLAHRSHNRWCCQCADLELESLKVPLAQLRSASFSPHSRTVHASRRDQAVVLGHLVPSSPGTSPAAADLERYWARLAGARLGCRCDILWASVCLEESAPGPTALSVDSLATQNLQEKQHGSSTLLDCGAGSQTSHEPNALSTAVGAPEWVWSKHRGTLVLERLAEERLHSGQDLARTSAQEAGQGKPSFHSWEPLVLASLDRRQNAATNHQLRGLRQQLQREREGHRNRS